MKLTVNGKEQEYAAQQLTVVELLKLASVDMPDMVSVELNGTFLDRQDFPSTVVKNGDRVEFLYFMGGGASL